MGEDLMLAKELMVESKSISDALEKLWYRNVEVSRKLWIAFLMGRLDMLAMSLVKPEEFRELQKLVVLMEIYEAAKEDGQEE